VEPVDLISRIELLGIPTLLAYFSATRRERAQRIQELYSCPEKRDAAEHLIQLEIDDHARSVVISLLRERAQAVAS
jgi:hypothetical protein